MVVAMEGAEDYMVKGVCKDALSFKDVIGEEGRNMS